MYIIEHKKETKTNKSTGFQDDEVLNRSTL